MCFIVIKNKDWTNGTSELMHMWKDNFVASMIAAARGLLATDHVILNHGQVTWTTPELAPPLLTTTPHQREDVSVLDRFSVHRCPTRRVFSGTRLELVTKPATIRCLYHSATAATIPHESITTKKAGQDRNREYKIQLNFYEKRNGYHQILEFDSGTIVAYTGCGSSFHDIATRIGRNPKTVIRIRNRWVQEVQIEGHAGSQRPPQKKGLT
ncbi:uncharacterized protein TNCV_4878341 [Trichonephila clavipes]|nr:uncharacterized protein TNCV_4878341 [Trichonephila clavipes]